MPKKCIKFIPGYLIPNLNNERFGKHLKWLDKSKNIFQIDWQHKAAPQWSEEEAAVFVEWDKHKGHFTPDDKQYFTKSKQRFRALLYKLKNVGHLIELKSDSKSKKIFHISDQQQTKIKRRTNSNVENESSNEDEAMSEQEYESADEVQRIASEDSAVNALEDHAYSAIDSTRFNLADFPVIDDENGEMMPNNFQDSPFLTSLSEPSDLLQRKILTERNYDISALMSTTNFLTFEDSRDGRENITPARFAGNLPMESFILSPNISWNQSTTIPLNLVDNYNAQPNSELDFLATQEEERK